MKINIAIVIICSFIVVMAASCGSQPKSELQERCDSLSRVVVSDEELAYIVRVQAIDFSGAFLLDEGYYLDGLKPQDNNQATMIPAELFIPVLLAAMGEELDTNVMLPVGYKQVYGIDVVDREIVRNNYGDVVDCLELRRALEVASHVAFVHLADSVLGNRRTYLLNQVREMLPGSVLPNDLDNDSVFVHFCLGNNIQCTLDALLHFYQLHVYATSLQEIMPANGLTSLVRFPGGSVESAHVGFAKNTIALVILKRSRTNAIKRVEQLWNDIFVE